MMDKITQALINAYKHDHPDVEEVLVRGTRNIAR